MKGDRGATAGMLGVGERSQIIAALTQMEGLEKGFHEPKFDVLRKIRDN